MDEINQAGGERTKLCFQCGKCDSVCPWNRVKQFSMRKLIREANFGLSEIEKDDIWSCTTCGKCPSICPRDVRQIEDTVAVRRVANSYNIFSESAKPVKIVNSGLKSEGNPFGEDRKKRTAWAEGLNVKNYEEGMEYLLFTDCYLCYDPRMKKVAKKTVSILNNGGVDYGILGEVENCCGESIRKTGNEELFKKLAKENIKNFIDRGVQKIIASSPHCLYTFKNEYSQFKVNFEVIHIVELLYKLIRDGKITFTKPFNKRVVYHDPCYLGRHSGIYDEPREILNSIEGLTLLEMEEEREDALCCGMGGGRVWMETHKEERFSNIRIEQAIKAGAEILVTACPYCITNFEDTRVVLGLENKIEIMDITEVMIEAI
ncbi:MAG: (Fe-S)-binding protein [Proteobacteria bacterium]|nr:(Fe-S)-binding protein [Pseudomonadota bacterium]